MARPGYPCYRNVLTALGCEVVEIADRPGDPLPADGRAGRRAARAMPAASRAWSSPARPTRPAPCCCPSELAALAAWCEQSGVQLISDEIYHGIEYAPLDGHEPLARSAWETSREAVVFSSFSKYFSMTGWRIGWMLVPERLRRAGRRADRQLHDLPAGARPARLPARRSTTRRTPSSTGTSRGTPTTARLLLDGLPRLGITGLAPADGAFYVYADVGHLTDDTMAFCHDLLGPHRRRAGARHRLRHRGGDRFVRLSFAGPREDVVTGTRPTGRLPHRDSLSGGFRPEWGPQPCGKPVDQRLLDEGVADPLRVVADRARCRRSGRCA